MKEYDQYDAIGLAALVKAKDVSAGELLDAALARTAAVNPAINAVCQLSPAVARAQIDSAAWGAEAPLAGVPFLFKDLTTTVKGLPVSHGSRLFDLAPGEADSELAARYRAGGLVFFGRTTTPEFGANCTTESLVYGGPTRNPWDLSRSGGGSSGGAAAAVAAGILPVAHASDGGGSIRIPASACGLFGLKPSRMRNPMGPVHGEGWGGMTSDHVVSRTVRDSALMLDISHGPDAGAPYSAPHFAGSYLEEAGLPPGALRVGLLLDTPAGTELHDDCRDATLETARLLERLGHHVEPVRLPPIDFEVFAHSMRVVVAAGTARAARAGAALRGKRLTLDDVELSTFTAVDFALRHSAVDYADAITFLHGVGRQLGAFMRGHDVLLTPTLTAPPVPLGTYAMHQDYVTHRSRTILFTQFLPYFNASGQPCMSVPMHWNGDGLPIGVQFVANMGREDLLFRLAAQLEAACPWAHRRPTLA
jgi:amidase